jgi:DNA gyrase subunit A
MTSAVVEQVPLHRATAERYLSYALSVITARALPDVRDGLKPVQRRILYTAYAEMNLVPGGRYRKCAAVVGEVMGKYHPHGDQSIYDALVRMAQDFSLRAPLVDGHGNFGSLDGDPPAAMRYTECRLRPLAVELISEIKKHTVDFRPTYDGQRTEPVVLPAQLPQLLVNGSEGIAVGMATRIPPHEAGEVIDAAVALVDNRKLSVRELMKFVKGPDFPTGGEIVTDHEDLVQMYETGQGSVKIRATWTTEKDGRRRQLVIDSIPYGQNKSKLVEHVGEEVRSKRLPQVVDVRDESTDDVRIVLELKQDAPPEVVMAYLYKRTQLQATWPVNLTALVPVSSSGSTGPGDTIAPSRLDLKELLVHWLDFRFETVRRRFVFDLTELRERIHLLEGFAKIFDALDEAIAIIRASEGRRDASEKLIARFDLSDVQADAVLELRLYKLAKLEIAAILEELGEKRAEATKIEKILGSDKRLWGRVRSELVEIRELYADGRRTRIAGADEEEVAFDEDAYIVHEDAFVVVTRDGWIKRQSSFSDLARIRVRDGDEIGWLMKASTRSSVALLTNLGSAYVVRVDSVPSTTGYGEPLQASFSFEDGERVVGVISHDERHRPPEWTADGSDDPPPPYAVAVTLGGRILRFPLAAHEEVSTRSGRRYARLGDGDQVMAVAVQGSAGDRVCLATRNGRATVFPAAEIPILKAAGKGVTGIKIGKDGDAVVAFDVVATAADGPTVTTSFGRDVVVRERSFGLNKRGGRGKVVLRRGTIDTWHRPPEVRLGDDVPAPAATDDAAVEVIQAALPFGEE